MLSEEIFWLANFCSETAPLYDERGIPRPDFVGEPGEPGRRLDSAPVATARKIRVVGDPVLHSPARPVTSFDDALATLVDDMFATLAVAEGVGLAAPQVGVDLAVFVYDCPDESGVHQVGHVVNPVIETSGAAEASDEGCLSVPGPFHELSRATAATVRGVDRSGSPVEV